MRLAYSQIPFIPISFFSSLFYHLVYWLLRPFLLLLIRKVGGRRNLPREPFIVAANHNSWIDGPLLVTLFPPKIKRRIYFLSNFWNFPAWFAGAILLNPFHKAGSVPRTLRFLERGKIICIFPEGKSNSGRRLLPGRTGVARLALLSGAPVVPVGIIGSRGTHFVTFAEYIARPWLAEIVIGKPLRFPKRRPEEITHRHLHETADAVMRSIAPLAKKQFTRGVH